MTNRPIPPLIAQIAPDGRLPPRQKRRLLMEMSLRKQKPGTGSSRVGDHAEHAKETLEKARVRIVGSTLTNAPKDSAISGYY